MKKLKTFEDHKIVNFKDLIVGSKNLSAQYYVHKGNGKFPYIKINGEYTEVDVNKSTPKNTEYFFPEQVEKYNKIAKEIKVLQSQQEEILK